MTTHLIDPLLDLLKERKPTLEEKLWDELDQRLALAAGQDIEEEREWTIDELNAKPTISLKQFIEGGWKVLEPGRPLIWNWHLDEMVRHLEAVSLGEITELVINVPPGTMKSLTVCVFWPAWEWHFMPWTRWLFYSYNQTFAIRDALRTRRLVQSSWYQRRWGHMYRLTGDQNEKRRYENTKTGFRMVSGFGGSVTGERADRVVIDDPLKADEAHNERALKEVNDTYDQALSSRLNDPRRSAKVIIMQRLAQNDLAGHVLDKKGSQWDHLCFPMEYEPPREDLDNVPRSLRNWSSTKLGAKDRRTKPGALLFPQRFPRDVVEKLKEDLGSFGHAAQNQQRPTPGEGGIFKREWWVFWEPTNVDLGPVTIKMPDGTHRPAKVIKLPLHPDLEFQSWDLAFKDLKKSSFVVGQHYWSKGSRMFLRDQVRGKMDFVETVKAMIRFSEKYPDGPKWVEDKANGPAVISTLKGKVPGIIAVNPRGDKEKRAWAQAPYVEAGDVVLPHPAIAPWVWDFIEEMASMPVGTYKDQADTFTQASLKFHQMLKMGRGFGSSGGYRSHVA